MCEGKTDNIYLKSAIYSLSKKYELLSRAKTKDKPYELLVNFLEYSKRTKYLLDLHGGCSYLKRFIERYKHEHIYFKAPKPVHPVILILDNDSGSNDIVNYLADNKPLHPEIPKDRNQAKDTIKNAGFIHVIDNLYVVLTPLLGNKESFIENLFSDETLSTIVDGRRFDPKQESDSKTTYGKNTFATKVVATGKKSISFSGFESILSEIEHVIKHYNDTI